MINTFVLNYPLNDALKRDINRNIWLIFRRLLMELNYAQSVVPMFSEDTRGIDPDS